MAADGHPLPDALYLQSAGGELRAFRFAAGDLADLAVWLPGRPLPGDLYLARVRRLEPALGLAFCDLGAGPEGILPLEQAPRSLTEGELLPVRLVRAAAPGKGPKLAPARGPKAWREGEAPRLLEAGADPLARFLGPGLSAVVVDSPDWRARLGAGVETTLLPGGFGTALNNLLEGEVEALLQPRVALGAGSLLIEPGETLTAIDVNLGAAGQGQARRAAADFNRLALGEIARQLRLRSLAGRVLVDCLTSGLEGEGRALKARLKEAVADDPERVEVKGMTLTGLLELTRRRGLFPPLHELLTQAEAPYGGRRLTARAEAAQVMRRLVAERRDGPARLLRLEADRELLAALERLPSWARLSSASASLLEVLPLEERGPERHRLTIQQR